MKEVFFKSVLLRCAINSPQVHKVACAVCNQSLLFILNTFSLQCAIIHCIYMIHQTCGFFNRICLFGTKRCLFVFRCLFSPFFVVLEAKLYIYLQSKVKLYSKKQGRRRVAPAGNSALVYCVSKTLPHQMCSAISHSRRSLQKNKGGRNRPCFSGNHILKKVFCKIHVILMIPCH